MMSTGIHPDYIHNLFSKFMIPALVFLLLASQVFRFVEYDVMMLTPPHQQASLIYQKSFVTRDPARRYQ